MRAYPGTLDEEWLDGETNVPIEQEMVQVDLDKIPQGELAVLIGRAAGEIRALRTHVRLLNRERDALHRELKALEEL